MSSCNFLRDISIPQKAARLSTRKNTKSYSQVTFQVSRFAEESNLCTRALIGCVFVLDIWENLCKFKSRQFTTSELWQNRAKTAPGYICSNFASFGKRKTKTKSVPVKLNLKKTIPKPAWVSLCLTTASVSLKSFRTNCCKFVWTN